MTDNKTSGRQTPGGKGHRSDCSCRICTRVRNAVINGKPPKKQSLSKRKQRFADTIAVQLAVSGEVDPKTAAILSGYSPESASDKASHLLREESVQDRVFSALKRAGITQDSLAQVAAEGLKATDTKLVTYEGRVTERVEVPDHHARHRFWQDLNKVLGNFPKEDNGPLASLVIVVPQQEELIPGHGFHCSCGECIEAYNKEAEKMSLAPPRLPDEE